MRTVDNNRLILVPCDFSPLSYFAMEHGANMAKAMKCGMAILHVTKSQSEVQAMSRKMNFIAEDWFVKFDVRPDVIVRQGGSPYSVIRAVANELNPMLVVLKTDGGVHTIKILSGTSTPYLVVQSEPKSDVIKKIAFPINFLHKHDEKLIRLVHFSEIYPEAAMHVITPSGRNADKERIVSASISLTVRVMENQGIKVDFVTHDKLKNTAETIVELSKDADMIVAQLEEVSWLNRLIFGLREEKLVTNADKIPVLCFNKDADLKVTPQN
jgi:nucleotide-binding universal stress UspA family protein